MLDGGTIEDPFSILSVSIEHPLQSDGDQVAESQIQSAKKKRKRKNAELKSRALNKDVMRHTMPRNKHTLFYLLAGYRVGLITAEDENLTVT